MRIDVLTLFPNLYDEFLNTSIIKRAINNKLIDIKIHNIRDYSVYNNNQVDDTPYGGGSGMVLMCDPIFRAIDALKRENSHIIMMSPQGKTYNQKKAYLLKEYEHIIILCGHYEGFDERILSIVDEEISVGDYVLTGGEVPSLILIDSITRLVDNVIKEDSHLSDSFNDNLLDYPTYTKPSEYRGLKVPDILLSGHHENIKKYREEQKIINTKNKRPDLMR